MIVPFRIWGIRQEHIGMHWKVDEIILWDGDEFCNSHIRAIHKSDHANRRISDGKGTVHILA